MLNQFKAEFFEMQDRYLAGASAVAKILEKREHADILRTFQALENRIMDQKKEKPANKQFAVSFLFSTLERQLRNNSLNILTRIK